MADINSNEKNNSGEREKRVNNGAADAHRNNRNNNHRRYHQKRPYVKNNDKAVSASGENQKTGVVVNAANTANDNVKKNNPVHPKSEGNKDFKKHSRPNNFERKRPNHGNVRVEETVQDIDIDIGRIEKEIELEIKEIAAFKFGL